MIGPPLELSSDGQAQIWIVERAHGGAAGPAGYRLAEARGTEAERLHLRLDSMSLAIRGPRVSWHLGSAGARAAVTGTWQPARDGFLLTAHPLTGQPAGETLDGYLYPVDGRPGCWELDAIYTSAGAGRITLARVAAPLITPSGAANGPPASTASEPDETRLVGGVRIPSSYDVTIRPSVDAVAYPELQGTLSFPELMDGRNPPWPPFILSGNAEVRQAAPFWAVTNENDAQVSAHDGTVHVRVGPEHQDGMRPTWDMADPRMTGLTLFLPYTATTAEADFSVTEAAVSGTIRLNGPPDGPTYSAEITGTRKAEGALADDQPRGQDPPPSLAGGQPISPWLDTLCGEFDLNLRCEEGFPGHPCVPVLMYVYPADLDSHTFTLTLVTTTRTVVPGFLDWSMAGMATDAHISGSTLAIHRDLPADLRALPPGQPARIALEATMLPRWWTDEMTLIEGADARISLSYDAGTQVVRGDLVVTDDTGREFSAAIEGAPRSREAELLRLSLERPRLSGRWRGVLGSGSRIVVADERDGWAPWPEIIPDDPGFLRHATGPDLAIGLSQGQVVVFERDEPAGARGVTGPPLALFTLGRALVHEHRYAEALGFTERARTGYAEVASHEDRGSPGGHAVTNALISACNAGTTAAYCALALGDYETLLQSVIACVAYRGRLARIAPHLSGGVLAGSRQLPGHLENWRLRLDQDAERIAAVTAGTPFFDVLVAFFLDLGAVEDALVASELSRARAFTDLLARSTAPGAMAGAAPVFSRRLLREILATHRQAVVEYFVTNETLAIWVAHPDSGIRYVPGPPGAAARVIAAAQRYRAVTAAGTIDDDALTAVLDDLYTVLWAPIARWLPVGDPDEVVVVVPHGPALLVPFPAFRRPDGRYLIERHAIAQLPAIAMLPMLAHRRSSAGPHAERLLALVDPHPLPEDPESKDREPFRPVPQTRALPGALAGFYSEMIVHTGPDATAAALLAAGGLPVPRQPSVVHLGTHAYAVEGKGLDPMDSFVALARTGTGTAADGRLRAGDVMGRHVPGSCVILAACATGRGAVTGDGVVGLSRAFLGAGPSALVLTLCPVDPDSSLNLTYEFHYGLTREARSPAQALARAQRTLIAQGEPVRCWSPFVAFGLG
ncbi:MAG: CHAT domain-containing protein [Streptosporangiaceae bacterium]